MKDKRQGAAAVVFLIYYTLMVGVLSAMMITRRSKRYIFSPWLFALIRFGANIATLGWAINLYDNFDWLIASLILGSEGYFALILSILSCLVGYEMEYLGKSTFYPKRPKGRNKYLHRMSHIGFWFEYSLIPANVVLVIGGSYISGALAKASLDQLSDPPSIPSVKTGQTLRIVGQTLFLVAIIVGYGMLAFIIRRATRLGKERTPLWWLAATAPFLLVRAAYGVLSSADWKYSYYLPDHYGPNGLKSAELIAEYLMAITMEAITIFLIVRAVFFITVKKAAFVPYDERESAVTDAEGNEMEEVGPVAGKKARRNSGDTAA